MTVVDISLQWILCLLIISLSGVVKALFAPYLLQAQEAGLPIWLEATNEHARDVYAHFGFEIVEEVIIGEGSVDENGNLVAGGKGIATYGMILEPRK